jgi:ribonuclease BN (tRNA processing enzyme)
MDLGAGCVANLQRHTDLFDVDAVVISHSHPDHIIDLYIYLFARLFSPERPPRIPLYVAPRVLQRFTPLLSDDMGDLKLAGAFDVHEVDPGRDLEVGPFLIRTAPMSHSVPTIGMRVEAGGGALAYSADTGPTDELVALARDAGILVAEASWLEDGEARPPIHLTAAGAGEAATRAAAGRLVLTHIRPYIDRDLSGEEASGTFPGDVLLAQEGMALEVGP